MFLFPHQKILSTEITLCESGFRDKWQQNAFHIRSEGGVWKCTQENLAMTPSVKYNITTAHGTHHVPYIHVLAQYVYQNSLDFCFFILQSIKLTG